MVKQCSSTCVLVVFFTSNIILLSIPILIIYLLICTDFNEEQEMNVGIGE